MYLKNNFNNTENNSNNANNANIIPFMEVYNKLNKNTDEFNFIDVEKYSNTFVLKDKNYINNIDIKDNINNLFDNNNLIKYITDTFTIVKCYNNNYVIINKQNKQKSKNAVILERAKLFSNSSKYKIDISDNLIPNHNNSSIFQRYNTELTQSITKYNKLNVLKIFITKYGNITSLTNKKVTEFVFLLLKKVFRNIFRYKGFSTVKEKIQKYVEYHSNTHITLYELTNKIKHKDIKILSNINKESNMESTKVLDQLMLFIFDTLVVDIINRTMYVTQHSGNDSRYYYYGREYYHSIKVEDENILKEESETEKENILEEKTNEKDSNIKNIQPNTSQNKEFIVPGRILLKTNTHKSNTSSNTPLNTRLIANCSSINSQYPYLVSLFRNEIKLKYPNVIYGHEDLNRNFIKYYSKNQKNKKYLHTFDIYKCFDNIDHSFLMEAITDLFTHNNTFNSNNELKLSKYKIYKYNSIHHKIFSSEVYVRNGSIKNISENININENINNTYNYFEEVEDIDITQFNTNNNQNNNFTDLLKTYINTKTYTKDQIFSDINNLIKNTKIKNTAIKDKGILQGLSISSYLCLLYLEYFKQKYFSWISQGVLLNYVDDFIFITENHEEYVGYKILLNNINKIVRINKDKVSSTTSKDNNQYINYFNYKIYNSNTLSIKYNYSNFNISNYNSKNNNSGSSLLLKIKMILENKLTSILFHRQNSKIYENTYDLMIFIIRVIKELFRKMENSNKKYYYEVVEYCKERIVERAEGHKETIKVIMEKVIESNI